MQSIPPVRAVWPSVNATINPRRRQIRCTCVVAVRLWQRRSDREHQPINQSSWALQTFRSLSASATR